MRTRAQIRYDLGGMADFILNALDKAKNKKRVLVECLTSVWLAAEKETLENGAAAPQNTGRNDGKETSTS